MASALPMQWKPSFRCNNEVNPLVMNNLRNINGINGGSISVICTYYGFAEI